MCHVKFAIAYPFPDHQILFTLFSQVYFALPLRVKVRICRRIGQRGTHMLGPQRGLCSRVWRDRRTICGHMRLSHSANGCGTQRLLSPSPPPQATAEVSVPSSPGFHISMRILWQLPVKSCTITIGVKPAQSPIGFAALDTATDRSSPDRSEYRKSSAEQQMDADVARVSVLCRIAPSIICSHVHCWQYMA